MHAAPTIAVSDQLKSRNGAAANAQAAVSTRLVPSLGLYTRNVVRFRQIRPYALHSKKLLQPRSTNLDRGQHNSTITSRKYSRLTAGH